MGDLQPFLFQFAQKAGSPPEEELDSNYYFDETDDLLHRKQPPENPPAIDVEGENGPKTKKHDVEKGDDEKDRGIWM